MILAFWIIGSLVVLVGISVFFGAPYVPSIRRDVRRLFDTEISLQPHDVVLDIGSGDGLVLREVSRRGAKAIGYEIHPLFVGLSRLLSLGDKKVSVRWLDAWRAPFPDDTTIVYVFAVGRDGKRLLRTIQREVNRLQRPLIVVCYGNALPNYSPTGQFEAYTLYRFQPLHQQKA